MEDIPEIVHEDHYFTNEWKEVLNGLNERYRVVMELYYVDGFSTKEIAGMLHLRDTAGLYGAEWREGENNWNSFLRKARMIRQEEQVKMGSHFHNVLGLSGAKGMDGFMRIDEYKNICDNVQISDKVLTGYQNAIDQIKTENGKNKSADTPLMWRKLGTVSKAAVVLGAVFVLSGSTFFSVKAYISHREKLRNIQDEEIVDIYENVLQNDSGVMSRPMTDAEDRRYAKLYDLYCRDMAEPEGEAAVISSKTMYKGEGLAFFYRRRHFIHS